MDEDGEDFNAEQRKDRLRSYERACGPHGDFSTPTFKELPSGKLSLSFYTILKFGITLWFLVQHPSSNVVWGFIIRPLQFIEVVL